MIKPLSRADRNNRNTADKVLQIVPSGSETANAINEIILKRDRRGTKLQTRHHSQANGS